MRAACWLDRLLQPGCLSAQFQPVFRAGEDWAIHYFEGLVRGPRGTNLENPEVLFGYARRKRAEAEVDRAALRALLGEARGLPDSAIGVNVHSSTIAVDLDFVPFLRDLLDEFAIRPERVVVELVEHGEPWNADALRLGLKGLQALGLRIAVDDFGTDQANYKMVLDCRPDYVKIERYFVDGCHADPSRGIFLESIATLARRLGARVVAEGVERRADLERARAAGIDFVQGFLLGRPAPAPSWRRDPSPARPASANGGAGTGCERGHAPNVIARGGSRPPRLRDEP
jgi:EAL domain-containing protein (putative c-di-GMP-specific phosphodiesterase class I)